MAMLICALMAAQAFAEKRPLAMMSAFFIAGFIGVALAPLVKF